MGQSIQESASTSLRLVKDGSAIACGGTLTAGDAGLTFSLAGQSGQYVIEADASAGTSGSWGIINGGCGMKRDTSTSKTFTVPNDGTVTVRATWATGYGSAVYKSPDCTYTVQSAASCSSNQYWSGSSCAACAGCPAGEYRTGCGGSSEGACQECASGTYKTSTGLEACTTYQGCPAGQYRKDCVGSSAGTCQACASGTYKTSTSSGACTTCQGCPAGQYTKDCGGSSAGTCQACASGTYKTSTVQRRAQRAKVVQQAFTELVAESSEEDRRGPVWRAVAPPPGYPEACYNSSLLRFKRYILNIPQRRCLVYTAHRMFSMYSTQIEIAVGRQSE
jgi:hypothetical protein